MRPQYFATALLVSCGFSVCASAETTQYATVFAEPDVPAKVVRYSDLNLMHAEGVAVLYRRIQVAAKGAPGPLELSMTTRELRGPTR